MLETRASIIIYHYIGIIYHYLQLSWIYTHIEILIKSTRTDRKFFRRKPKCLLNK